MLKGSIVTPIVFIVLVIVAIAFSMYITHLNELKLNYFIMDGKLIKATNKMYFKRIEILNFAKVSAYLCSKNYCYNTTIGESSEDLDNCIENKLSEEFGDSNYGVHLYGNSEVNMSFTLPKMNISENNINIATDNFYTIVRMNENFLETC